MKKLFLVIGGLIFIAVAGFIAVEITKQVVKSITQKQVEKDTREIVEKESSGLTQEEISARVQEQIDQEIERSTKNIMSQIFRGSSESLQNRHKVNWSGHEFEVAHLDTTQYQTTGNKDIQFTATGWFAPSYSMPRTTLLSVNLNQKIKLKIIGNFEGSLKNWDTVNKDCGENINWYGAKCLTTEAYRFSEFATYIADESGNRQALRLLGTRQNIIKGNNKEKYNFTSLIVENTGDEIAVFDSTGFKIAYSKDFKYVTTGGRREENRKGDYGELNQDQKWMLAINCHVNGEGYCKLDIKEIQVGN